MDEVLLIYSNTSNHGQTFHYHGQIETLGTLVNWEPDLGVTPHQNEINKRNYGLKVAKSLGFTHFLMMDCDECYEPLAIERKSMENSQNINGFVHALKVYIKKPTLQCDDHTLVPGIHRLNSDTEFTFANKTYPFAYDEKGNAHIDPTRRPNFKNGIVMSGTYMHHFSHVRKNIQLKMNNSSARKSLLRSSMTDEHRDAHPGYYSEFYRQNLKEVPNSFGIEF